MSSNGTYVTNGACVGLPTNAAYYGSGSSYALVNANYGTTLTGAFSVSTPVANTCQFNCMSGYSWNGSTCLTASVNGACTGLPSNAVYYGNVTSYTLAGAALGTSLTASYTGGTLVPNTCMYGCASGYGWNGTSCITASPYSSSTTYTPGQAFTYNGATISVTATGLGTSSTKTTGCDTNDIVVWQGGTNNVQIWAACNAGATTAFTSQSYPSGTTPTGAQEAWMGGLYQWGNNTDVTAASTSSTQVSTSGYGP